MRISPPLPSRLPPFAFALGLAAASPATVLAQGDEARADFERLVEGSLQVFPMKGDFAIQVGSHRFVNHYDGCRQPPP